MEGMWFAQGEGSNRRIKLLSLRSDHLIGAMHCPKRGGERTSRGVLERLSRRENGLLTNDSGTFDFFHLPIGVGDDPMPTDKLSRDGSFIGNGNSVEKEPLVLVRVGS